MEISYLGHSSFKLSGKNTKLVTDPYDSKMVGLKYPKVEADIVTISHHHPDHDKSELIEGVKKIVDGPGEYEIAGVSIIGIASYHDNKKGEERGKNTIYKIEMDGLNLVHLGDLGHTLTDKDKTEIGEVDIMLIPVGGEYTIDAKTAFEIVKSFSPKVVIPMHYKLPGMSQSFDKLTGVEEFLTISGLASEKMPKLSVKPGTFAADEIKVVVLDAKK